MTDYTLLKRAPVKKHIIPYSLYSPNQSAVRCWENEEVYGIPTGEKTFEYKINDYGFRWTRKNAKRQWLFVGCSHTFGQGVSEQENYPEIICNSVDPKIECINVGMPGTGPQIQALNLAWAINTFNIERVFWYMPTIQRQIFVQRDAVHTYHPSALEWFHDKKFAKLWDKVQPNLQETTYHKTIWELYSTFSILQAKNIPLHFRCWEGPFQLHARKLNKYFDIKEIPDMPKKDMGRDWLHRGPGTHKEYARMILETLK